MFVMLWRLIMISVSSDSSGEITPVKILMRVVFPAPLWPSTPISSPGSISTVRSLSACTCSFEHVPLKVLFKDYHLLLLFLRCSFFTESNKTINWKEGRIASASIGGNHVIKVPR